MARNRSFRLNDEHDERLTLLFEMKLAQYNGLLKMNTFITELLGFRTLPNPLISQADRDFLATGRGLPLRRDVHRARVSGIV